MDEVFDIQSAAEAILNDGELVMVRGLLADRNRFEAGDSNGLFEGNVSPGVSLLGKRSLVVKGEVGGMAGNLCYIEVEGDLVVIGNVRQARIVCRNLCVGGSLLHSQVTAVGEIAVGSDLAHSQLRLGDYEGRRRRIEELRHALIRGREQRTVLDRRIGQDERRLDRSCKATRVPLNFNISRLVVQEQNRIRVNLESFYASLGDQPLPKVRMALNEFFAKGFVGYLTRANRRYIADNPAREKIFLQLLKSLRGLVVETFERDQLIASNAAAEKEIERLIAELRQPQGAVWVQGGVLPETQVEFLLPDVQRLEGEVIHFVPRSASLKVGRSSEEGMLRLEMIDVEGERSSRDLNASELQRVALSIDEGEVVWKPVARDC